jgi:hypothetical protein
MTARKQLQERLSETGERLGKSEERLNILFEFSSDWYWEQDADPAFAFPILVDEKSAGVMEFYNREIREPDASLLQSLRSIGSQIGLLHGRKQMEARQAMEDSVTHLLAEFGSPERAMAKIIQTVCEPRDGTMAAPWVRP